MVVAWMSRDLPDPDKLTDRQVAQSTKIYDRSGEHLLYEIYGDKKRTLVELSDIPKDLINGLVATEDKLFYEHNGVRPLSILRSIGNGLIGRGRIGGGASTITQQLIKNAILINEGPYTRKPKEIILSLRIEQKYTKDQILKIYFNEIPYGSTNYGVEAAAQSYFKKHVSELNLQESATLAGIPKSPSRYLTDRKALKDRRDFVLQRMHEEGYITKEAMEAAQKEPLTVETEILTNIDAPHFVLHVKKQLEETYGVSAVNTGGFRVITTLDWNKQQIAEKIIKEQSEKFVKDADADNAALVAIHPPTGEILAMVGSRDFFDDSIGGQFNVITQAHLQPGSSIKPIIYAAAFEKGFTPDTVLFDVVTDFDASNREYIPKNYDLRESGLVTMRKALQGSLNIPAVKTLYLVGESGAKEFTKRLGYSTLQGGDLGLSLVLGGGEVIPLEHVNAFATLANQGKYHEPISILKVEDNNGEILFEQKSSSGEPVLLPEVAATVSNVLSDDAARSFVFGAGGTLTLPGRPVAAKTGTTQKYKDAWTVGYTPSLASGVWIGNSDGSPMKAGYGGSRLAGIVWNQFMKEALKGTTVEQFPTPPANTAEKPVLRGGNSGIKLLVDRVTGKLATSSTPENYIEERVYVPPHDILHYVIKDDPRGPVPTNPAEDPQYFLWETGVQDWIRRNNEANPSWSVHFDEPPTEFDDIHSLELIPIVEILSPQPNVRLTNRQITADIRASAPRGVSQVTYKIDGAVVAIVRDAPFSLNYFAPELTNGEHALTIIVEDDIGNQVSSVIPFTLDAGVESPRLSWSVGDTILSESDFPRAFFLNPFKLSEMREVRFYTQRDGEGNKQLVSTVSDLTGLFNNQVNFTWTTSPGTGVWFLIPEIVLTNGSVQEQGKLRVIVQ